MICTIQNAKSVVDFGNMTDVQIGDILSSIEHAIRKYTNNNFQNRNVRFTCSSVSNVLNSVSPFLKIGDTIQVSDSAVNDGLYTIKSITASTTEVNESMFDVQKNLVTKVEYPSDVVDCALNMASWKVNMSDKIGIKSETISRHSVTYEDSASFVLGYPKALFSSLDRYKKARC